MMRWRRAVDAMVLVGVVAFGCGSGVVAGGAAARAGGLERSGVSVTRADGATEDEHGRTVQRDLRSLADAWATGGGTYGYPYWQSAWDRWRDKRISTAMFREYVLGYRDQLRLGCQLIDATDVQTDDARAVAESVVHACRRRVDALDAQRRWLDALIEHEHANGDDADAAAALASRISDSRAEATSALEESYRLARAATNDAQARLDALGVDRIAENAFV